jgi:hypothetical protein
MHNVIQFEDRVSRSRSKHEGESSTALCDRLIQTRDSSQRQLPTDHDHAVPTRVYQLDQSSPKTATAAADPVLERQQQNKPANQYPLTGHSISVPYRQCSVKQNFARSVPSVQSTVGTAICAKPCGDLAGQLL